MKLRNLIVATALGVVISTGAMAEGLVASGISQEKALQRCGNILDSAAFLIQDVQMAVESDLASGLDPSSEGATPDVITAINFTTLVPAGAYSVPSVTTAGVITYEVNADLDATVNTYTLTPNFGPDGKSVVSWAVVSAGEDPACEGFSYSILGIS